jgi:hypothetical protein
MEGTTLTYAISKGAAALTGLFGGLSIAFFWQPKKLHQHGKLAAGAIIGGIATSASFALGGVVASIAGLNFEDIDIALGIGYLVGALSVGVISFLAKFFDNHEGEDLLEVARKVKSVATSDAPATKRRQGRSSSAARGKRK